MKPDEWTLPQIETQAENFLKSYNPKLIIPIPIEEILELQLNIRLIVYPELENKFGVNGIINMKFQTFLVKKR